MLDMNGNFNMFGSIVILRAWSEVSDVLNDKPGCAMRGTKLHQSCVNRNTLNLQSGVNSCCWQMLKYWDKIQLSPWGFGCTGHFWVTGSEYSQQLLSCRSRRCRWARRRLPVYQVGDVSTQDQSPSFHCELVAPWYSCFCRRWSKVGGERGLEVRDKTGDFENCRLIRIARIGVSSRTCGLAGCGWFHGL